MIRLSIIALFLTGFVLSGMTQGSEIKGSAIGIEVQQYPTGFLLGANYEFGFKSHHAIDLRVGYNLLDHQDFGVHEDEEGGGFGFSLGYKYYFKPNHSGWFLGLRSDLWFNSVDWRDNIDTENEIGDNSEIVVLQPTFRSGYKFIVQDKWVLTPSLAFGAEINIKTTGEEIGQGAILLWGFIIARRF